MDRNRCRDLQSEIGLGNTHSCSKWMSPWNPSLQSSGNPIEEERVYMTNGIEDARTRSPESTEQGSYKLTDIEVASTEPKPVWPGPLHICCSFQVSVFMGLPSVWMSLFLALFSSIGCLSNLYVMVSVHLFSSNKEYTEIVWS